MAEEPQLKSETLWVIFEQNGHEWMVGAPKQYARVTNRHASTDLQTELGVNPVVKIYNTPLSETIVHWGCCTTNVWISEDYKGTVQIGSRTFHITELLTTQKEQHHESR
jgi:hypothetical protein